MEQVQGIGRVLPSLLTEAGEDYPDTPRFYQWQSRRWQGLTAKQLKQSAIETALGLQHLGLQSEEKIAFLLHSEVNFIVADLGSLLAGLVNVPIDLTQTIENIIYILNHCEAKALIVGNLSLLDQILPYLGRSTSLKWIIVAEEKERKGDKNKGRGGEKEKQETQNTIQLISQYPNNSICLKIPSFLGEIVEPVSKVEVPECLQLVSLDEVQQQGRKHLTDDSWEQLLSLLKPNNLATIIYIAGDDRQPNGVMLTHENIVTNVLTSFKSFAGIAQDSSEIALSFLPLTHIFARSFFYGHLSSGHQVYFSNPNHLMRHLQMVKPTILITVPLLLEKIYHKIVQKGEKLTGWQKWMFKTCLDLAHSYRIGNQAHLPIKYLSQIAFKEVKSLFGGNLKALISGGASLNPSLANFFMAMGIPLVQGYGLTETSGVVTYTQHELDNCAETVGTPIAGVSIKVAEDGEILINSPFVTLGYYHDSSLTGQILDEEGWLHTGDIGFITATGNLQLTGVKKAHFKLSTGKYVSALPLETQLQTNPLIKRAIALAPNYKFCSILIFPDIDNLLKEAEKMELDAKVTMEELLQNSCILALYQKLIDETNCHLPYWSHVRKFKLINYNPENLTDRELISLFQREIDDIYDKSSNKDHDTSEISSMCPVVEVYSCPAYAQSMQN
jgi:long-chain acyl-CoA synthetase